MIKSVMKHSLIENKFSFVLAVLIFSAVIASFSRVYLQEEYDIYFVTKCVSEDCFVFEDDVYALIQKSARDVSACTTEDCLIDESCLGDGSCKYIDCSNAHEDLYYSGYTCN